jgi:hypothetical protein
LEFFAMSHLAAVTAWFNPSGSTERESATLRFAQEWPSGIPLYPVFNRHSAPIWQKERLLNLAIRALPSDVDKVIWIDGDLLIDTPTWAADVSAALDNWPVIQPWTLTKFCGKDGASIAGPMGHNTVPSVPFANLANQDAVPTGLPATAWPGFCWAARRETLEDIGGLYEHDLSGPNDVLMSLAFYGDLENTFLMRYSGAFRRHFDPWAERAFAVVKGNVGFVPATLTHLWHGPFEQRRYLERTVRLYEAGYDPSRHVGNASDGTLVLTDTCPPEVRRRAMAAVGVKLEESDWSGHCTPLADVQAATARLFDEAGWRPKNSC